MPNEDVLRKVPYVPVEVDELTGFFTLNGGMFTMKTELIVDPVSVGYFTTIKFTHGPSRKFKRIDSHTFEEVR